MTDDQFNTIIDRIERLDRDQTARLDGLQAEMETRLAAIQATLTTLAIGQVNLFNLWVSHLEQGHAA